jgi:hypothetical protein
MIDRGKPLPRAVRPVIGENAEVAVLVLLQHESVRRLAMIRDAHAERSERRALRGDRQTVSVARPTHILAVDADLVDGELAEVEDQRLERSHARRDMQFRGRANL